MNLKKKIVSLCMAGSMAFLPTPFSFFTQEFVNPFAADDAVRQVVITQSQEQADSEKVLAEITDTEATSSDEKEIEDGYIVQFKGSVTLRSVYQCVSNYPYKLLADSKKRLFVMAIDDVTDFTDTYGNLTDYVSKSTQKTLTAIPNDTYYAEQWALTDINLPAAWDQTKGSAAVKVAVIDSGFYRNHEDLSNSTVMQGVNVCTGASNVTSDAIGHGTMVTSIIAATTNNAKGMAGACWNVSIIPYKVAQSDGSISSEDVIKAIILAADSGCDVINMSLGGYEQDTAEQAAINYAVGKGCIIVAAAGNEGGSTDLERGQYSYPASDEGVISAASIDQSHARSDFSQYNDMVDVCAPGEDIIVAYAGKTNAYATASGTSFSSPYVAAVAALARSQEDNISAAFFEQLIKQTSTDLGTASKDDYYGWGLINAEKIVANAKKPIVCGVENDGVYEAARTVTFNKGTATLNGKAFTSGSAITADGAYTLIVTDTGGNTTTVSFIIDQLSLAVSGIEEGGAYNKNVTVTFSRGTATLNGQSFTSGSTVSKEGGYTLILTSTYGKTATFSFTIDKTAPVITGVANGVSYAVPVTIGFNEGTGVLNGGTITSGYTLGRKGNFTLVVTDAAGNATTVNFVITKNYAGNTEAEITTTLTQWVLDETGNKLYAISGDGSSLLRIDGMTLAIDKTIALEAPPTDIIMDDGMLYVALDTAKKILVYDVATLSLRQTITTTTDPFRIVKDGNMLYYLQRDQWCGLYRINLETNAQSLVETFSSRYMPDIAVNTTAHILYIGESGSSGSHLYYFSTTENKIISKTTYLNGYGYPYPDRAVYFDGEYVFYAGRAFSAESATVAQGDYNGGQTVLFAKYGCVFTNSAVYDEETHVKAGDLPSTVSLFEASGTGSLYLYDKINSCLAKITGDSGTLDADDIIAQSGGTPAAEVPLVTQSTATAEGELSLSMPSELTQWVEDDASNTLYAVSASDKALFFMNATTLHIEKTIRFTSSPTDIELSNGKLYIPLDDINQIPVIDVATQSVVDTLYTASDPYRVALDGDKLYYAEKDQWCDVYEYTLSSGTQAKIAVNYSEYPDLAVNTDSHILYIGTSGSISCSLVYYSTANGSVVGSSSVYSDCLRSVVFDGTYVYYDGKAFDPLVPSRVVDTLTENNQEYVLYAKDGYVFTNYSAYFYIDDEYLFEKLADFPSAMSLAALSGSFDLFLYDKVDQVILREDGGDIPPVVTGVEDGAGYIGPVTITFDKGTALLDGNAFTSGDTVSALGEHILTVTDEDDLSTTVIFTIYAPQADDGTAITFADGNLKQALLDNGVDRNDDGVITHGEMRVQHFLMMESSHIADLTGLEYAVNLQMLDVYDNEIYDIRPIAGLPLLQLDVSENYLDLSENSDDMQVINRLIAANEDMTLIYTPQKDAAPVITIAPYIKTPTNRNITVTATTSKGSLNAASHTFTQNGSFDFVATDGAGSKTVVTVTITNIDKKAPVITIAPYDTAATTGPVTVTASTDEGTLNAASHTFAQNGSFDFVATDAAGNTTTKTVTVTNIIGVVKGDITGDGSVDGLDLLKLKKYLLGQITLSTTEMLAADVTGDYAVDGLDLLKIKKFLLGQVVSFS